MTAPQKPGLPVWAKILLGIFCLFVVSVVATAAFIGAWWSDLNNPQHAAQVAGKIAKFAQPLPANLHFQGGQSLLMGMSCVVVTHDPDNSAFTIFKMPNLQGKSSKDFAYDMAIQGNAQTTPMKVEATGVLPVGGEQMDYVQGSISTASGARINQLVGVISPKNQKLMVVITGSWAGSKDDLKATNDLLASIQGF